MREDDDPEKQRLKGQTEVKHEILRKYLQPWLLKITEVNSEVRYIDGFAGWGRYQDGSPGSPLIAMNVAQEIINEDVGRISSKLDSIYCDFIEENESNYGDLEKEVNEVKADCPSSIKTRCLNQEFEDYAREYIDMAGPNIPTFIFIDPFGFSGLPFDVINELMNLRTTGMEVFISFMSGKMAQYFGSKSHNKAITSILGTDRWREEIDEELSKEDKAQEFVRLYEDQLRNEADVNYVWPFRMTEEGKEQTNYFLVHATNHFDGFKLMKDIMFRAGAEDKFAYLGPSHYPYIDQQQKLADFDIGDESQERIQELSNFLHKEFRDRDEPLTLNQVMKETYQETKLIEKHYRKAGKLLKNQGKAEIIHHPDKANGTKPSGNGFGKDDEIEFYAATFDQFT